MEQPNSHWADGTQYDIKETPDTQHLMELLSTIEEIRDNIKKHLSLPALTFPFKSSVNDRVLNQFDFPCNYCNTHLMDMRGSIKEIFGTIEINAQGFCPECSHISTSKLRWNKEGQWLANHEGEWYDLIEPTRFVLLLNKFFSFFRKG